MVLIWCVDWTCCDGCERDVYDVLLTLWHCLARKIIVKNHLFLALTLLGTHQMPPSNAFMWIPTICVSFVYERTFFDGIVFVLVSSGSAYVSHIQYFCLIIEFPHYRFHQKHVFVLLACTVQKSVKKQNSNIFCEAGAKYMGK